jgi:hypothetical protein
VAGRPLKNPQRAEILFIQGFLRVGRVVVASFFWFSWKPDFKGHPQSYR